MKQAARMATVTLGFVLAIVVPAGIVAAAMIGGLYLLGVPLVIAVIVGAVFAGWLEIFVLAWVGSR